MKDMKRRRGTGDAVMLVTALLMGSSYPVAKDVLAVMSPLLYSSSRYLIAGLLLLAVIALRRQPLALPRRDWLPILLLSLLGVTLFQACWGYGISRTSPSVGSIVMTTTTTFSALFAWMQGRRLSALGWTGIAIAFAGVLLVVNNSLSRITLEVGNLEGAAFWLVAAFCWALYVDRSVPYSLRLGSLRVVAWTTLLGALVLLAVALCFDSLSEFSRLDDRWIVDRAMMLDRNEAKLMRAFAPVEHMRIALGRSPVHERRGAAASLRGERFGCESVCHVGRTLRGHPCKDIARCGDPDTSTSHGR